MGECKIAVLGGDRREVHIARLLADDGYDVALFGCSTTEGAVVENSSSLYDAVRDAQWLLCPSPGLGPGDVVYVPGSKTSIVLNEALLALSDGARGGLVLGNATPTVAAAAAALGIPVFEMKGDRVLAISNATAVAEAVTRLLIEMTERLLREYRIIVVGYGATGAAITDYLLATRCGVTVAARSAEQRVIARQRGAAATHYDERIRAFQHADIIINTVPDRVAVPEECFEDLRDQRIVDIASPPGGLNHEKAQECGLTVTWARGLAGSRPFSVGEAQLAFLLAAMAERARAATPA